MRLLPFQPSNIDWPEKDQANLPKGLDMLPLFEPESPQWERYLRILTVRRKYKTTQDYITYAPCIDSYIWVPANFVYDFASVPKAIPFLVPDGTLAYGATPHDFGYRFGGLLVSKQRGQDFTFVKLSRGTLDKIFLDLNNKATGLKLINYPATWLLRICGLCSFSIRNVFMVDWSKEVY